MFLREITFATRFDSCFRKKNIPSNPDFFRNLNIMLIKCKESQTLSKVPLHAIIHL